MRRTLAALVFAVAVAGSLTACTARPTGPSEAAVANWYAAQSKHPASAGAIGALGIGAAPFTPNSGATADGEVGLGPGGGPWTVTGLSVRCYGADTASVRWRMSTTDSETVGTSEVSCDKKLNNIPLDLQHVTKITVTALKTPTPTAWFVTVNGK